ncbi:MAG: hypothetical protein U0794_20730 [Isosphaeraceae bacterium]
MLLYGTSLVKFGVAPTAIEAATGRPSFNLALANGQMASSYYMLRKSLRAGARPLAIVVDKQDTPVTSEDSAAEERMLAETRREWPELLGWNEMLDLAWNARDASLFGRMGLARLLESYKTRYELRGSIMACLMGTPPDNAFRMRALRFGWAANKGVHLVPLWANGEDGATPPPASDSTAAPPQSQLRRPTRLSALYRERFLELAESRGVHVFWLLPPLPDAKLAERDQQGISDALTTEASEILARHRHVTVLDGRRTRYPNKLFHDHVHLNAVGATLLSEQLGARMAEVLSQSRHETTRWVNLSPYEEAQFARVTAQLDPVLTRRQSGETRLR